MRRTMNPKGFLLVLGVILLTFLVAHGVLGRRLSEQEARERELQESLAQLEEEHRLLNSRLEVVGTKDYIVASAIGNYSYMNKNDIRFEFSNPDALFAYSEEEWRIWTDEMRD